MIKAYFDEVEALLKKVRIHEYDALLKSAQIIANTIENEGIVHLFGSGHSHMLAEEVYYRAGGLVPIKPILYEPLMLHHSAKKSSELERKENYAQSFMKDVDLQVKDALIVISNSGKNPVPIEVAEYAKKKGVKTVGITSLSFSEKEVSRHSSGKYLKDFVDLTIDNHIPVGDALLGYQNREMNFAPGSTLVGVAILQSIFAESIKIMYDNDFNPPILKSANIEGADQHNEKLFKKYSNRITF